MPLKISSVGSPTPTHDSAASARLFKYTIRPSPFLVCGSITRPLTVSISNLRRPRISDLLIPRTDSQTRNRLKPARTSSKYSLQFGRLEVPHPASWDLGRLHALGWIRGNDFSLHSQV